MLALLETLIGIIRLRKGPDAIPHSMALFLVVVAFWLLVDMLGGVVLPDIQDNSVAGLAISLVGLLAFAMIVNLGGKKARLLQTMTALIGCGALLGSVAVLITGVTLSLDTESPFVLTGVLAVWAVMAFSIVVDGHILSRTLEWPRLFGVIVAFLIFVLQYNIGYWFNPAQSVAA